MQQPEPRLEFASSSRRDAGKERLAGVDPLVMPLKLAAFTSFIAAMPYLLHQLWGFVAPGLYLREKKFALPLLASSILLFYAGMAFAYFVLFTSRRKA